MDKVKATRMEYLKLRQRIKVAKKGHKLLKEKRDGLMKKFMDIVREAKTEQKELQDKISSALKDFAFSTASLTEKEIEQMFSAPNLKISVESKKENVMSVWIPKFSCKVEGSFKCYSDLTAPYGIDDSLKKLNEALEFMLKMAELEHSARLLSFEIETTRRRVNALEYVVIPTVESNIKLISSKLDEQERSEKTVRMIIKELIA